MRNILLALCACVALAACAPDPVIVGDMKAPAELQAEALSPFSVRLSWKAIENADSYVVYSVDADGTHRWLESTQTASYTDTALEGSTRYGYCVTARATLYNESPYSNTVWVTTAAEHDASLDPVTAISAQTLSDGRSIALSWDPVPGAAYYEIIRKTRAYQWDRWLLAHPGTLISGTSFTDTVLPSRFSFAYRIRAFGSDLAYGPLSEPVEASTSSATNISGSSAYPLVRGKKSHFSFPDPATGIWVSFVPDSGVTTFNFDGFNSYVWAYNQQAYVSCAVYVRNPDSSLSLHSSFWVRNAGDVLISDAPVGTPCYLEMKALVSSLNVPYSALILELK